LRSYRHYTSKEGYEGILKTGIIKPSLKSSGRKDATFGDGVYLTTIEPIEVARALQMGNMDVPIELFGTAVDVDTLDYYFQLILPENEVSDFRQLYLELIGEDPDPEDIRRISLFKTNVGLKIGDSIHGKTEDTLL
jgi:HYD1 signature containing ADP-ribosyltransferase